MDKIFSPKILEIIRIIEDDTLRGGFRIVFPEPMRVEVESFKVGEPKGGEVLIETEAALISTGTELSPNWRFSKVIRMV